MVEIYYVYFSKHIILFIKFGEIVINFEERRVVKLFVKYRVQINDIRFSLLKNIYVPALSYI